MAKSVKIVTILANEPVAQGTFRLTFSEPEWAHQAHAGHFINVQIPAYGEILWRRPFSVHRVDRDRGTVDILYTVVGRGSAALSRMQPGESLNVVGLLGNTFSWDTNLKHAIVVAGGVGIAPFLLLLQDLAGSSIKTTVLYGVRSAAYLCSVAEMQSLGANVLVTTEDGSYGEKGVITEMAEAFLTATAQEGGRALFVCGPSAMLHRMQQLLLSHPLPAQVTVENLMACGFGACVGCVVPLVTPRADGSAYALACKDGPVFSMQEIICHA